MNETVLFMQQLFNQCDIIYIDDARVDVNSEKLQRIAGIPRR